MDSRVWVSAAPRDISLELLDVTSDLSERGINVAVALGDQVARGLRIEEFPRTISSAKLSGYRRGNWPKYWPELLFHERLALISQRVADVLQAFDLGQSRIARVEFAAPGSASSWYAWEIANRKDALLPDECKSLSKAVGGTWRVREFVDDNIACSSQALAGPDVWTDPMLRDAIFFSERLATAISDAGLATEKAGFGELKTCRIV